MNGQDSLREKALEFLRKEQTAVVATVGTSGEPQAATITFTVDNEFNLYFITRKNSRKYANIMRDPRVSIAAGFDSVHPSTIQLQGKAEVVSGSEMNTVREIAETLSEREYNWWPLLKVAGLDFAVVKVKPEWARWLNLDISFHPETFKEDYHQIIP